MYATAAHLFITDASVYGTAEHKLEQRIELVSLYSKCVYRQTVSCALHKVRLTSQR